jgi:hypothetical protein
MPTLRDCDERMLEAKAGIRLQSRDDRPASELQCSMKLVRGTSRMEILEPPRVFTGVPGRSELFRECIRRGSSPVDA